jgi:hypothetical protein
MADKNVCPLIRTRILGASELALLNDHEDTRHEEEKNRMFCFLRAFVSSWLSGIRSASSIAVGCLDSESRLRDGLLDLPVEIVEFPDDVVLTMLEVR